MQRISHHNRKLRSFVTTSTLPPPEPGRSIKPWQALAAFLLVCYAVAAVGTLSAVPAIPTWYAALHKPSFNPPNWIFPAVWTVLYGLMAFAAWLVWSTPRSNPRSNRRTDALMLFATQLVLNFLWTPAFFHFHAIRIALVIIILLWLAILLTAIRFWRLSHLAAWLMLLYLAWVTFATALNFEICRLN